MKIALVLSGNKENAPYYLYYTRILNQLQTEYDIISWDRLSLGTEDNYCFRYPSPDSLPFYKKMIDFYKYSRYVKKILLTEGYDLVIAYTLVNITFLGNFLIKRYPKRFLVDIRDYSPILPYVKTKLRKIFNHALLTTVSSPGFLKWLPGGIKYTLCHNVKFEYLITTRNNITDLRKPLLNITSFGLIRDHEVYKKLFIDLSGSQNFKIILRGIGTEKLHEFVKETNIDNVSIAGRYNKAYEEKIISSADIIFIVFPRSVAHDGIMSNRFYHAVVNRKPMIVNEGNIQADYVKKFNLGITINEQDNYLQKINSYIDVFDPEIFNKGCENMIELIKEDMQTFENKLNEIIFYLKHNQAEA